MLPGEVMLFSNASNAFLCISKYIYKKNTKFIQIEDEN